MLEIDKRRGNPNVIVYLWGERGKVFVYVECKQPLKSSVICTYYFNNPKVRYVFNPNVTFVTS